MQLSVTLWQRLAQLFKLLRLLALTKGVQLVQLVQQGVGASVCRWQVLERNRFLVLKACLHQSGVQLLLIKPRQVVEGNLAENCAQIGWPELSDQNRNLAHPLVFLRPACPRT